MKYYRVIVFHAQVEVKIGSWYDDRWYMIEMEALSPLEIEIKKVEALGGTMAVIVLPESQAEQAMARKRDMDTCIKFQEYFVIGMFGVGAEEASSVFFSLNKGIAVFPKDGKDITGLFLVAVERLRSMDSSPWVRRLWDTIRDTKTLRTRESPEKRYISSSFYQFYSYIASQPEVLSTVFSNIGPSEQGWIKDLLPYGVVRAIESHKDIPDDMEGINSLIENWGYQEKVDLKHRNGADTLRKFRNIEHLFTLPSISRQIINIAGDPMLSAAKMANVIENDPVLTSRLLKVVNSAFYGFHRQIDSVEHAVVILGNEEVVNLAFSIAVYRVMENVSPSMAKSLWMHSLEVAHLAHWLGPIMGCSSGGIIYTIGLLHDLGKIVFLQADEKIGTLDSVSTLENLAEEEDGAGLSHAEMGAYVAERWNLPETIADGLMNHHIPGKANNRDIAMTVHVADIIAHCGYIDVDSLSQAAVMYMKGRKGMNLSSDMVQKAYEDISSRVRFILEA